MANVVVTTINDRINVTFNDDSDVAGAIAGTWLKENITLELNKNSSDILVITLGLATYRISYDGSVGSIQVDSVNGVAPASNQNLYDLLKNSLSKDYSYYDSSALEASAVIKAAPGVLYSISGYNNKPTNQYIQVFNSTTVPADTAVPIIKFEVKGRDNFFYEPSVGRKFTSGVAISNSSTLATKTIGSANCLFTVIYE